MRSLSLCALAALSFALGCGNGTVVAPPDTKPGEKPDTQKAAPPAATAKRDTPKAKAEPWGTVKGRVTYGGARPPALAPVVIPAGACPCPAGVPNEEWVINKANQGVANAFVWLVDASDPKKPKAPPVHSSLKAPKDKQVVIDQPCCKFEPHALALRQGQVLVAKNSSTVAHNFKWEGEPDVNDGDNKLIPAGGKLEIDDLKASPKPVAVSCTIHPWMKAWVRVFDHPYYAVTDKDGKFEIKNAPAGKYNLVMWHESVGWVNGGKLGRAVEIPAGDTIAVNEQATPE